MISGAHVILYSKNADADRAFLRDILRFTHVDVGGGWLIFGLPPAEVAVHPTDGAGSHELYLMCEDVEQFRTELERHGIATGPVQNAGWGLLTDVALPGGGKLGVYQPRHARPEPMGGGAAKPAAAKPAAAKPAAAKPAAAKPAAAKPAAAKPAPAKPAAAKPAAAKPAAAKPAAAKKPAAKPAAKKPAATKKPAAKRPAGVKKRR
jgi:catechol 2,3-dioxygenase-like lactoylglutathione lyase family enzyme